MAGFTIYNDEELHALEYLPHPARSLYIFYLKRHLDRESGIVGIRRRISRQGMREILEVHRDRGSRLPDESPTTSQIRAALRQLADRGLIRRVKGYENLPVYRLPLARPAEFPADQPPPDYSDQTRSDRGEAEERPPSSAPEKADSGAGSGPVSDRGAHTRNGARSAPPPLSIVHSHSVAAAVPDSARARDQLRLVLLELFPDQQNQIDNNDKVQQMLDAWCESMVCARHIRKAHQQLSERQGLDSFGPVYLRGLVLEHAAADGLQEKRERNTEREAQADRDLCQSVEQWAKERGLDWDPRNGEAYSTWLERMRLQRLDERKQASHG